MAGPPILWKAHLAGCLVPLTLLVQLAACLGPWVPDRLQVLALPVRVLESLAPHVLVLSLLPAVLLVVIGYRAAGGLLAAVAVLGGLGLAYDLSRMRGMDAAEPADLTVLWLNLFHDNPTPPERLADAIIDAGADVVMLGEADTFDALRDALSTHYPHGVGCAAGGPCSAVLLSRMPIEAGGIAGFETIGQGRLLHARIRPEGVAGAVAVPLDIVAMHLIKPWYIGFTGAEQDRVDWVLRRYRGPLVVAGDFNAAPWSRRMRWMHDVKGLEFPRHPVATWPARAGALGVPIDHVLTRGGAAIVSVRPWGEGLGSNHRGLLARIALP